METLPAAEFAIIFGMLVVYFVNYYISRQGDDTWLNLVGWRWMFASEIIPASLFLIMLIFVPDTPRSLVLKSKSEKALLKSIFTTDLAWHLMIKKHVFDGGAFKLKC